MSTIICTPKTKVDHLKSSIILLALSMYTAETTSKYSTTVQQIEQLSFSGSTGIAPLQNSIVEASLFFSFKVVWKTIVCHHCCHDESMLTSAILIESYF